MARHEVTIASIGKTGTNDDGSASVIFLEDENGNELAVILPVTILQELASKSGHLVRLCESAQREAGASTVRLSQRVANYVVAHAEGTGDVQLSLQGSSGELQSYSLQHDEIAELCRQLLESSRLAKDGREAARH